ncbi:helix-turn-helix transcriptional regulator [Paraeggerthella hominis]|uniref:helix-turn-helix transcriptional regulator n=1 Tax=Paraeggerthella hominis TaxID=2897351 RepID=UPI003D0CE776
MSFRDNLQHLRDLQDMSQADLAQQIGVSRQSVAKWEAEKSYPEMDKLIKICDLFGCSLDDLVRGDLAGREAASAGSSVVEELAACEGQPVVEGVPTDAWGYDEHMRRRAWDVAAAVAVVILGFGAGINFTTMGPNVNPSPFVIFFSIGVALALLLVKPTWKEHRAFLEGHPHIDDFYTSEQKDRARSAKGGAVVGAVVLVIAGLNMPGLFGWFQQYTFAALAMFGCFALAAALVVYAVMMDRRTNVARYNRLFAAPPAAEPDAVKAPTADDTVAS